MRTKSALHGCVEERELARPTTCLLGFGYYYIRGENHVYHAFFANISLIFRKTEFALFQKKTFLFSRFVGNICLVLEQILQTLQCEALYGRVNGYRSLTAHINRV